MNLISSPLQYSSPKHLWYPMSLGKTSNKTVRNTITENIAKPKFGHKYYLLKDEEAYTVGTTEIEFSRGLTRDTNTVSHELQKVLHGMGRQDANKTITFCSALRYSHRVIARLNKEK